MSNLQRKSAGALKQADGPEQQWLDPGLTVEEKAAPEAELLECEKMITHIYPLTFNQEEEFSKAFYFYAFCGLLLLSFFIWFH